MRTILLLLCFCFLVTAYLLFFPVSWLSGDVGRKGDALSAITKPIDFPAAVSKRPLIRGLQDLNLDPARIENRFTLEKKGIPLIVESSLDSDLQSFILNLLEKSNTVKAAVVVMRPDDGRILAMASYDSEKEGANLCLNADYPAASLFKIVSAAAALESAGFSPEKQVSFVGRKHTLYRNQLKNKKSKYAATMSFKRAFASSINPVFGKLGIYDLGGDVMMESAEKFFFNRPIPFDFPVGRSEIQTRTGKSSIKTANPGWGFPSALKRQER
jgi:penicillin-binding protein A